MSSYKVKFINVQYPVNFNWNAAPWEDVEALEIANFLPDTSGHHPITRVKLFHNDDFIVVLFNVVDRFVRSIRTEYHSDVWRDSCVEFFVQPKSTMGYFNFEINTGGTLHVSYVEDPTRIEGGNLKKRTLIPFDFGKMVVTYHSMPSVVDPEIADSIQWSVGIQVPRSFFEHYVGELGKLSGQNWRANFNKCADQTSHPHWATWAKVSEKNFHRPWEFGTITLE